MNPQNPNQPPQGPWNPSQGWAQPPQQGQWPQQPPQQGQWPQQAPWPQQPPQQGQWPPYAPPQPPPTQQPWGQQPWETQQADYPMQPAPRPEPGAIYNTHQAKFFTQVFGWMTMGLGITAAVAWTTFATGLWTAMLGLVWPMLIAQIGLVWWLTARTRRADVSPTAAIAGFLGYAALNGLTLSVIFAIYAMGSIATAFIAATMMFGFMFVLGAVTKKDLSGMRGFFVMSLVGMFVGSIVNMLAFQFGWFPAANNALYWGMTYFGVLLFAGLTAYDSQMLKEMAARGFRSERQQQSLAVMGALQLYLDFINLFIYLLRIFGRRE